MNLPPLPTKTRLAWGYTAEQMQAYGQQCREAALEEAATMLVDAASRLAACPRSAENEAAATTLIYQAYKIRDAK